MLLTCRLQNRGNFIRDFDVPALVSCVPRWPGVEPTVIYGEWWARKSRPCITQIQPGNGQDVSLTGPSLYGNLIRQLTPHMETPWQGNAFCIAGPLWGESTRDDFLAVFVFSAPVQAAADQTVELIFDAMCRHCGIFPKFGNSIRNLTSPLTYFWYSGPIYVPLNWVPCSYLMTCRVFGIETLSEPLLLYRYAQMSLLMKCNWNNSICEDADILIQRNTREIKLSPWKF